MKPLAIILTFGLLLEGVISSAQQSAHKILVSSVFIDSLKTGSNFRLKLRSSSCFSHYNINIRIFCEKNGLFAVASNRYWYAYKKKPDFVKRVKIQNAVLDTLRQIELELVAMQKEFDSTHFLIVPGDCMGSQTYTFTLNGKSKTYEVMACQVGDYDRITKLFGLKDD